MKFKHSRDSRAAANPLFCFLWGLDPPSSRRRRHLWRVVLAPVLLFAGAWMAFYVRLGRDLGRDKFLAAALLGGVCATPLVIALHILLCRQPVALRRNWMDYRLAGFHGRQMLMAHGGPWIIGAAWAAIFMLIAMIFGQCYSLSQGNYYDWEEVAVFAALGSSLMNVLIGSAFLDVAMWTYPVGRLMRFFAPVALVLISPFAVLYLLILGGAVAFLFVNPTINLYVMAGLEFVAILPRAAVVWVVWRKAVRRLDGYGPAGGRA